MDYTSKFKFGDAEEEQSSSEKQPEANKEQDNTQYATPGHIRNICFVQEDGSWEFFNYNYLVNAKYNLEENALYLFFTSHIVIVKGANLSGLGFEIMAQITRKVLVINERYRKLADKTKPFISSINIQDKA